MNSLILPARGKVVLLLFFYEDVFGVKQASKIDMSLNKETKLNDWHTTM